MVTRRSGRQLQVRRRAVHQARPAHDVDDLSANTGIPFGALVRYVLARWASAGSEALLAAGPSVVERMWQTIEEAEAADTDESRLEAYDVLRQMVSWLRVPLGP